MESDGHDTFAKLEGQPENFIKGDAEDADEKDDDNIVNGVDNQRDDQEDDYGLEDNDENA